MSDKISNSIPDSWQWKRLEEIAEINPSFKGDTVDEDIEVSFVPMKRVEELSGHIDLTETRPLSEIAARYTYFADGDVIFAKITPCMENGKVAVAERLQNGIGFGSTEFHVIRPSETVLNSWLARPCRLKIAFSRCVLVLGRPGSTWMRIQEVLRYPEFSRKYSSTHRCHFHHFGNNDGL